MLRFRSLDFYQNMLKNKLALQKIAKPSPQPTVAEIPKCLWRLAFCEAPNISHCKFLATYCCRINASVVYQVYFCKATLFECYYTAQRWNRSGFSRPDPTGKFQNHRQLTGWSIGF